MLILPVILFKKIILLKEKLRVGAEAMVGLFVPHLIQTYNLKVLLYRVLAINLGITLYP